MNEQREPLALTLEEAYRELSKQNVEAADADFVEVIAWPKGGWIVVLGNDVWPFDGWPEAFHSALGRPVVARDSAAELKAAATRLAKADAAYNAACRGASANDMGGTEWNAHFRATGDEFRAAVANVRRLAGEEQE